MTRHLLIAAFLLCVGWPQQGRGGERGDVPRQESAAASLIEEMQEFYPAKILATEGRIEKIVLPYPGLLTDSNIDLFCPSESLVDFRGTCSVDGLTRKGIRKVAKCPNLRVLMLYTHLHLDASTLELIGELEHLEVLFLLGADLELDGVKHLANLKTLKVLALADTNLNDESLKQLAALSLKGLDVGDTGVTREGLIEYCKSAKPERIHVGTKLTLSEADQQLIAPTEVRDDKTSFLMIKLSKVNPGKKDSGGTSGTSTLLGKRRSRLARALFRQVAWHPYRGAPALFAARSRRWRSAYRRLIATIPAGMIRVSASVTSSCAS